MNEQITSMIRTIGKFIGGLLVGQGILTESMVEPAVGVMLAIGTMVWSYLAHKSDSPVV